MSCQPHNHTANARKAPEGPNNARGVEDDFTKEIKKKFRRLRGLIRATVGYTNDAFDLSSNSVGGISVNNGEIFTSVLERASNGNKIAIKVKVPRKHYDSFHSLFGSGLTANAEPREAFDFPSNPGKIAAFIRWLQQAIREEILEPVNPVDVQNGRHWSLVYIREAFRQGVNQSTGLLFQQGASIENIPNDEIVNRPIFQRTLQDLYTRAYSNLESITEDIAPTVRETLTEGFAQGWNPKRMARELTNEVRDIERTRAETLARSETINAHSSAALRNYERAGVGVVGHTNWSAADDTRTCPFCRRMDGIALTLDEMRSGAVQWRGQVYRLQPPAHPSGRCVPRPAVGATPPTTTLHERLDESFEAFTILSGG